MDKKLIYLTKTLSRTNRKDYENYVINTLWNRIACPDLIPVTQQLIKCNNGKRHFIDLYFPQLNIGIECDEKYHKNQKEDDEKREITIFHVLKQINENDNYKVLHVVIDDDTSFEDVDNQINEHVKEIIKAIKEKNIIDGWNFITVTASEFYADKDFITVKDTIPFSTIKDASNTILGKNYKGCQKCYFPISDNLYAWFPKLAINGMAAAAGWRNTISEDGKTITEFQEDKNKNDNRNLSEIYDKKRVVFTKVKDSVTNESAYHFVGVFIGENITEKGEVIYKRIDTKFEIIRP